MLREDALPAPHMTQEAFANAIGAHRATLSARLRKRRGLKVERAAGALPIAVRAPCR